MQANMVLSLTKQFSTLNAHSSCGELVSGTCFNVTPWASALSTGGALLDALKQKSKYSYGSVVLSVNYCLSIPRSK